MVFNFVISFSMWLLVTLLLLMTTSSNNAVEGVKVIGSTNVSTVHVGQPFTFRCEVTEYELNENFNMWFFYTTTNKVFAFYTISDPKSTNAQTNFYDDRNDISKKYISQVQPLVHRYPTYEVSITPQTAFSTEFYCNFYQPNKNIDLFFNHVPVNVIEKNQTLPQLNLTSSLNSLHLNEPFTLTCSLSDFDPVNKNYSISYYNSRDSLLASYKIDATGKSYLFAGEDELFSAHHGPRSAFPVFDLIVTEKVNRRLEYWCELEIKQLFQKYQSPHWKSSGPFVDFTATYNSTTPTEHRGKCSVENFAQHASTEYKMQFYSSLGPKVGGDNLLAYYWVQPNATPEFVHELHQSPWTSITAGGSIFYPNFEIVASVLAGSDSRGKQRWWCVLSFGEQHTQSYRQIKSNVQPL